MAIYSFCGREVSRLYTCRVCRGQYCIDCISPRNLNCV